MLTVLFVVLLGLALTLLVHTYLGYPATLWLMTSRWSVPEDDRYRTSFPSVCMIVPAHNEEAVIEEKVKNATEIQYPSEFRCLFVSDSSDRTDEILKRRMSDRMDLLSLPERRGKSHAINRALEMVNSDIVVFSDANTMYEPNAVRELVAPLADDGVGCVTGQLRLRDENEETAEGSYWRYELWIRRSEAKLGTTVSVNGGLLAMRARDIAPLPEDTLVDDFVLAMRAARAGRRVVFAAEAVGYERPAGTVLEEFARRIRIGAGNYQALVRFAELIVPRPGRALVSYMFVSHKVIRWLAPWLLVLVFVTSLALAATTMSVTASAFVGLQASIYALACAGVASKSLRSNTAIRAVTYFAVMNAALALGCIRLIRGATSDIWSVTARD